MDTSEDGFIREWLTLAESIVNPNDYKKDITVYTPKFDKSIMRVWTASNGRTVVYAEVDGDMFIARYFHKRRQAKKWIKQRMEEVRVDVFTDCYPTTVKSVTEDPNIFEATFEYGWSHHVS